MTKLDIIKKISAKTGIETVDVRETIETLFYIIGESMSNGENVYVRGFGSFVNKKRKEKVARNIKQNTAITVAAHYKPSFKPSKKLTERVKKNMKVL